VSFSQEDDEQDRVNADAPARRGGESCDSMSVGMKRKVDESP